MSSPIMPKTDEPEPQRVVVTDVDISFNHLMWLLVKTALAAVPATIILAVVGGVVGSILYAVLVTANRY